MISHSSSRYALLCFSVAVVTVFAFAASDAKGQDAGDAAADKVPVKLIVLFSSGVGYVEHRGKVDGDATVDLEFDVEDINDLLKSMVLEDLGGGQISTVTYGSRDPITKTLATFAIDLTQNPTLGQLLGQIRGERVEIDGPTKIEGKIVGVEKKRDYVAADQVFIEKEYLNVLTSEGLRRVALDSVDRIELANQELGEELRQALDVLAQGHATDKKTVTLKFLGQGERDVRVGYIREAPVWKTSYRLVLDDEDKPFLQGWAIVENTTDTDWQDVRLSLVSGRPISFVMDLYSPLYAQRPVVVPELYASLRPQVYEQDLAARQKQKLEEASQRKQQMLSGALSESASERSAAPQAGFSFGGRSGNAPTPASDDFDAKALERSVQTAAQGGDVGELFQYDIENPVTLARQRSAMLPIVNKTVEGKKVSIYNAGVHAKHPLNGFELKNTSDLHLMQGPVTVFDGGVYAGDARLPDLPPGDDRLLSYAMDLDVEVAPTADSRPRDLLSARIEKGVLIATYKQSRTHSYTMKNSGDDEKTVLVEHPAEPQWKLVEPQEPTEKTRGVYRFSVAAKPGEPVDLKIEEQNTIREDVAITNLNDQVIAFFLRAEVVSDSVKEALRDIVRRKAELADLHRRKKQTEHEIATIGQEQERIRQNMQSIARDSDLYNRYVTKFTVQEDQIEKFRGEEEALDQQIAEAQKALDAYLASLNLS